MEKRCIFESLVPCKSIINMTFAQINCYTMFEWLVSRRSFSLSFFFHFLLQLSLLFFIKRVGECITKDTQRQL